MKRFLFVAIAVIIVSLTLGVAQQAYSADKITYVGCGIVKQAFAGELAKKFSELYGVQVDIIGGGATVGIRDVASGKHEIGGTCRHALDVSDEENVKLHHVAWDALAVIVNQDNPVDSISLDQLKGIIEGRITDWGKVGGPSGTAIEFYAREGKISGVGLTAREIIFHDADKDFSATKYFDSTGPLEKAVEKDKWSIGITGISSARKRDVKIIKLNGIDISKDNISSGSYLLYRPLYLVTSLNPTANTAKFIEFAKSREGQAIISRQETVNLREGGALWRLYRNQ